MSIPAQPGLIGFVLLPGDVPRVAFGQKHLPAVACQRTAVRLAIRPFPCPCAPVNKRSRISRVVQEVQNYVALQFPVDHLAVFLPFKKPARPKDRMLREVLHNLPGRSGPVEGFKEKPYRPLDLLIWFEHEFVALVVDVAGGWTYPQLSASGFVQQTTDEPGAQHEQLRLRDGSLQP